MFITAVFTMAETWKQTKCLSMDESIKKMWCIHAHTMEYYSVMRKKEILPFVITSIDQREHYAK